MDNDVDIILAPGPKLANTDDDNGNGVIDRDDGFSYGGENDLYPVQLDFPPDLYGAEITLTVSTGTATIWDSPNKGVELAGPRKGGQAKWVMGPSATVPRTVWLEVTHGSTSMAGVWLTLAADQGPAQPASTQPTYNTITTTRPAIEARIVLDCPDAVSVGELVRVHVHVVAPGQWVTTWDVPEGVVFGSYDPVVAASVFVPYPYEHPDGDTREFRWMRLGDQPVAQTVLSATVQISGEAGAVTIPCEKPITVLTPIVQTTTLRLLQPVITQTPDGDELHPQGNPNLRGQNEGGLIWRARVVPAQPQQAGQWAFLNVVTSTAETWVLSNGQKGSSPYRPGLHTGFPYAQGQNARNTHGAPWPLGQRRKELKIANHRSEWSDLYNEVLNNWKVDYDTHIMFKSDQNDGNWVPLQHVVWGIDTVITRPNAGTPQNPGRWQQGARFTNHHQPPQPALIFPAWNNEWNNGLAIDEEMRRTRGGVVRRP